MLINTVVCATQMFTCRAALRRYDVRVLRFKQAWSAFRYFVSFILMCLKLGKTAMKCLSCCVLLVILRRKNLDLRIKNKSLLTDMRISCCLCTQLSSACFIYSAVALKQLWHSVSTYRSVWITLGKVLCVCSSCCHGSCCRAWHNICSL